ncbi:gas vesicle protein K [Haloferacaceae archaeon DSL9]
MKRVELEGEDPSAGLQALVIAVVELVVEALELEALRRMDSGALDEEEIERLGSTLAAIDDELTRLKKEAEIEQGVAQFRNDLASLVDDAITQIEDDGGYEYRPAGATSGDRR